VPDGSGRIKDGAGRLRPQDVPGYVPPGGGNVPAATATIAGMQVMTEVPRPVLEARMLAGLAADYPCWHVWRSRDGHGRDCDWNATRRKGEPVAAGAAARLTAATADGLREQLGQQEALVAA
jgi:hypothetical protein